ncbi:MAG: zinc ribbon domain-containing protein [Oscillochloridaceae bacterium umkhey_bin13]
MVERICAACQHGNPIENRFCGACGTSLDPHALAQRPAETLTIAGQAIPMAQVRQVGQAVAMGLVAVAAEAGLAWLRRRGNLPTTAITPRPQPTTTLHVTDSLGDAVTIVSQRVVEIWDHGTLTRQIVEKHIWKKQGS